MGLNEQIVQKFELEAIPFISREDLEFALAQKVAYMMKYQLEELFSKLYRLDIFESKIKEVMDSGGDIAQKIAGLIIDRQMEKEASKINHPSDKPTDADLAW